MFICKQCIMLFIILTIEAVRVTGLLDKVLAHDIRDEHGWHQGRASRCCAYITVATAARGVTDEHVGHFSVDFWKQRLRKKLPSCARDLLDFAAEPRKPRGRLCWETAPRMDASGKGAGPAARATFGQAECATTVGQRPAKNAIIAS